MKTPRLSPEDMAPIRKRIIARDGHRCVKCSRTETLEVHHMHALMDGGTNEDDNLVTLCAGCHAEWEAIKMVMTINFTDWLATPTYSILYMLWHHIPNETTMGQAKEIARQAYDMKRSLRLGKLEENMERLVEINERKGRTKREVHLLNGEVIQVPVRNRKANAERIVGDISIGKSYGPIAYVYLHSYEGGVDIWQQFIPDAD